MTGFIKPNAVNLLGFWFKPIRGHAGGKITIGDMIGALSVFEYESTSVCLSDKAVILSYHRLGVLKTMVLGPLFSLKLELFTSLLSTLSWISAPCFPQETLKTVSGVILISKTTWVYITFASEIGVDLVVWRQLHTAIVTSYQLHVCQTQTINHVIMLNKM